MTQLDKARLELATYSKVMADKYEASQSKRESEVR
jgi:hypothetical protein